MRENIGLYRGQRKDCKEWVEGYLGVFKGVPQIFVPFTEEQEKQNEGHIFSAIGGLWYEVIPETVGQYTGLTDKNGKKIFEGDIINCRSCSNITDFENSAVHWSKLFVSFKVCGHCLYGDAGQEYEIIGNIHDNPELLEVSDNG